MFTNVVWATDGSEHAERAREYATRIAQRDGATLHVAHVVEKLVGARVAGQNANLDEEQLDVRIRRQAEAIAAEHGIDVKLHLITGRTGDVALRIAEIAHDTGADLIVIGTRGHSAVVGAVIGSVTQRLLHVAGCAVLAVPPLRAHDAAVEREPALTTAG